MAILVFKRNIFQHTEIQVRWTLQIFRRIQSVPDEDILSEEDSTSISPESPQSSENSPNHSSKTPVKVPNIVSNIPTLTWTLNLLTPLVTATTPITAAAFLTSTTKSSSLQSLLTYPHILTEATGLGMKLQNIWRIQIHTQPSLLNRRAMNHAKKFLCQLMKNEVHHTFRYPLSLQ